MGKLSCILNFMFWNKCLVSLAFASVEIVVPSAGNCGDDTVLTCVVKNESIKYTGWFGLGRDLMINGQAVRPEDSEKYAEVVNGTSFSLTIKNTDIHDQGQYRCRVGFSETPSKTLIIECVPNTVQLSPTTKFYQVEENGELNNVSCTAYCAPKCKHIWSDGHGNNISTSSVLALGKVDRTSQGEYICTALNWFGKVNETIFLTISYGPETIVFTPTETTYFKNEGDKMNDIQCSVICNPNCTVEWIKTARNEHFAVSNSGSLKLGNVHREDAGEYKCVAVNKDIPGDPSIQTSLELNVRYGPDTVKLSSRSEITLIAGEFTSDITCSSECNPTCHFIRTYVNGTILSNDSTLSLGVVEVAFQGEYRCTVSNNATGKTIYTSLTVIVESGVQNQDGNATGAVIGGVVGLVILLCLIATISVFCYKRKRNETSNTEGYAPKTLNQCNARPQENETSESAYEELKKDSKKDVYDQLNVSITDVSAAYVNILEN